MKKVIALVLALCMVFAMSAVAFAVEETITKGAADQEGTVVVRTVFDDDTPGAYDSYTVTIPADVTVDWGADSAAIPAVKVDYQLAATSSLSLTSTRMVRPALRPLTKKLPSLFGAALLLQA